MPTKSLQETMNEKSNTSGMNVKNGMIDII